MAEDQRHDAAPTATESLELDLQTGVRAGFNGYGRRNGGIKTPPGNKARPGNTAPRSSSGIRLPNGRSVPTFIDSVLRSPFSRSQRW